MNDRDLTNDVAISGAVPSPGKAVVSGRGATTPSSLAPEALARRLGELAGDERQVQVDFLLHLDEFDRRRAFLEAGYDSLWSYCLRALHLREGPAGRRIGAMRVLRRFPALEGALRDGRLCLSTITVLGPLLTLDNLDDLVARAAYRTKAEVEHLVVSLQPRTPPKEGIRKLPGQPQQQPARALAAIATERDRAGSDQDERRCRPQERSAAAHPHSDPGAGPARGVAARWGLLHLEGSGRPKVRKPLEARVRPHQAGPARRRVDRRQRQDPLQGPQPPPRGADLRARAHVALPDGSLIPG